jgi:hypothetical protein
VSCSFPAAGDGPCSCTADDAVLMTRFVRWLFSPDLPGERLEPILKLASERFGGTRCVTRAVLDSVETLLEIDLYAVPPFSDAASHAFRGHPVPAWPDGETRSGPTWNELFHR